MNTSPLQAIELIAKGEDRARSIVFFLFFARFEYALKRAGFTCDCKEAKANWSKYAEDHTQLLTANRQEPFVNAIDFLKNSPPKKQVISGGCLDFKPDCYTGAFDLKRVFILLGRIRNNLFHGGKFPAPKYSEDDISRDEKLLNAGLAIMAACLDSDDNLKQLFLEQLV